jgi:hypothetical protein
VLGVWTVPFDQVTAHSTQMVVCTWRFSAFRSGVHLPILLPPVLNTPSFPTLLYVPTLPPRAACGPTTTASPS